MSTSSRRRRNADADETSEEKSSRAFKRRRVAENNNNNISDDEKEDKMSIEGDEQFQEDQDPGIAKRTRGSLRNSGKVDVEMADNNDNEKWPRIEAEDEVELNYTNNIIANWYINIEITRQ